MQVIENCAVQQILNHNGKVVAVGTNRGTVECQYFVNCGGFWARKIGKMSEPYVKVPLHACEHYYLHTKPIPGLDPMTPGKEVLTFDLYVEVFTSILHECKLTYVQSSFI